MAILPIRIVGEPVLHRPAAPVTTIDESLERLIADMRDTMAEAPGVGLAAPQVGVDARLFIWDWTDDDDVRYMGTAINPELWISPPPIDEPDEWDHSEGCLSVPGERFPLMRSDRAILRATGLDGEPFEREAHGWLARIFQHEYDHLDGVLHVDRLVHPHGKLAAKAIKRNSWGGPGQSWTPGIDRLED